MQSPSEQRIETILAHSPVVTYTCRIDGNYELTYVSDNLLPHFGYSSKECLNNENFWREVVHPDDHAYVFDGCESLLTKGQKTRKYRFRKKDGLYLWVLDELRLIRDAEGSPVEIVGAWLDISDRKQKSESLHQSEPLFRALFDANPIPTIISSPAGIIHDVNPAFLKEAGFDKEEVVGRTAQELGFWDNPEDRAKMVAAVRAQGFIDNLESVFYDKDKQSRTCLVSSRAIEHKGDLRILNTVVDITEQRKAEKAMLRSEKLFRDLFMANPVPTIISSPDGVVLNINHAFTLNPGYTPEEVVGRTVQDLGFWKIPEDRDRMIAAVKKHGFIDNLESQFYGKGQRLMTCLISSRTIEFEGTMQILSTVLDVTEQRKAEEEIRKLEKAKSDFISTVAHELRTPLIAVIGYCELLENAAQMTINQSQKEEYLGIIQSNAEVLNRLVDDLLDIGRIQIGRPLGISPEDHDLVAIIDKVVASYMLKDGRHEIVVEHGHDVPRLVRVDAGRIAQVFYNLLSNAIKFSPAGGFITVRLGWQGGQVTIAVIDHGIGMSPQQIKRMFEHFYRADEDSSETLGLGLGMSIVKQIVTDHGGEISVESQPGRGSTVTVSLPIR